MPDQRRDAEPATAAPKVREWMYERVGGAGVKKPLWECTVCGCAVTDKPHHDRWHQVMEGIR